MNDATKQPAEALKKCPFCRSHEIALEDCRTAWLVRCKCGASMLGERAPEPEEEMGAAYWDRIRQSAIDRWNTRALASPQAQQEPKP